MIAPGGRSGSEGAGQWVPVGRFGLRHFRPPFDPRSVSDAKKFLEDKVRGARSWYQYIPVSSIELAFQPMVRLDVVHRYARDPRLIEGTMPSIDGAPITLVVEQARFMITNGHHRICALRSILGDAIVVAAVIARDDEPGPRATSLWAAPRSLLGAATASAPLPPVHAYTATADDM